MEHIQQLVTELNNALSTMDFVKKSIINNLQPILDGLAQEIQAMKQKIEELENKLKQRPAEPAKK